MIESEMEKGKHVYLIADPTFGLRVKVGTTRDVTRRLNELQTGSSTDLHLITAVAYSSKTADEVEQMIHRKYASKNVRGEWFDLSPEDVKEITRILMINMDFYGDYDIDP